MAALAWLAAHRALLVGLLGVAMSAVTTLHVLVVPRQPRSAATSSAATSGGSGKKYGDTTHTRRRATPSAVRIVHGTGSLSSSGPSGSARAWTAPPSVGAGADQVAPARQRMPRARS